MINNQVKITIGSSNRCQGLAASGLRTQPDDRKRGERSVNLSKMVKFHFTHSKLRKRFFTKNETGKCQNTKCRGLALPCPPFRRPCL